MLTLICWLLNLKLSEIIIFFFYLLLFIWSCFQVTFNFCSRVMSLRSFLEDHSNTDHFIGRLDPWGVWLMQKGKDLVCVNQYR